MLAKMLEGGLIETAGFNREVNSNITSQVRLLLTFVAVNREVSREKWTRDEVGDTLRIHWNNLDLGLTANDVKLVEINSNRQVSFI